jgi:DNA (cytosine-5)-methyltransferase 1
MRLLDLFCGAGGASSGYHRAGFDVTGVDSAPQRHYPFRFIQADALEYACEHGREFDVIHASPPCQAYSAARTIRNREHPDLIAAVRAALLAAGRPFVIENVPGAPLENPLMLCGTMFGLRVIRHRLFEIWPEPIWFPPSPCNHNGRATSAGNRQPGVTNGFATGHSYITVVGNSYLMADGRAAMGIDWMNRHELSQAIPPAYTEWIGRQLLRQLEAQAA